MTKKMRQERQKRGWTQLAVADSVGISREAIQQLETGATKPSYDVLVKLENLFGLSHRQLFADTETPENGGD